MAKTYDFVWNFGDGSDVIETEKAYGFKYHDNRHWSSVHGNKVVWLPKSKVTVEPIPEPEKGTREYIWWQEGDCKVSVPMWLARANDYFKGMLE